MAFQSHMQVCRHRGSLVLLELARTHHVRQDAMENAASIASRASFGKGTSIEAGAGSNHYRNHTSDRGRSSRLTTRQDQLAEDDATGTRPNLVALSQAILCASIDQKMRWQELSFPANTFRTCARQQFEDRSKPKYEMLRLMMLRDRTSSSSCKSSLAPPKRPGYTMLCEVSAQYTKETKDPTQMAGLGRVVTWTYESKLWRSGGERPPHVLELIDVLNGKPALQGARE